MTLLDQIPNELLEEIFSSFDSPDLASISLVSRHLHVVAEPFLYRVVRLTYHGSTPSAFRLFSRTILDRSELARYVQVLALRWIITEVAEIRIRGCDMVHFTSLGNQVVPREPQTYSASGSGTIELSKTSKWIEYLTVAWRKWRNKYDIFNSVADALLLFYLLPSLQCLDVLAPGDTLEAITDFLRNHYGLPHGSLPMSFHSLRELRLKCSERGSFICPFSMLASFQLCSLRKLNISHLDMNEPKSLDNGSKPGTSPITHLSIRPNRSSKALLATTMAYPRALTHLELVYTIGNNNSFQGPLFGTTLQPLRDTLQQLTIYLVNYPKIRLYHATNYIIGSLRDWPFLRRLRCPLVVLLGREWEPGVYALGELLPKVIVQFVVEVDGFCGLNNVVDEVVGLVRRKKECGLDLFRELAVLDVTEDHIQQLQAPCVAAGVELIRGVVLWDIWGDVVDEE